MSGIQKQAFRQHVVNNQKSYASVVSQNILSQPKPNQTFTFTAEHLTKFVANVVIFKSPNCKSATVTQNKTRWT